MATAKNNPNLNYSPERLVSAAPVEDDSSFELKLRPQRLAEFIGQAKVKENLAVAIEATRSRGEALDHVLLYGPPGLGKTTLATIIANELGVPFQQTSGPTLQIKLGHPALRPQTTNTPGTLEEAEREHILQALQRCGWRIRGSNAAAELLGVKPTTLESRIKKLGIVQKH